jgi:hypothetical protein
MLSDNIVLSDNMLAYFFSCLKTSHTLGNPVFTIPENSSFKNLKIGNEIFKIENPSEQLYRRIIKTSFYFVRLSLGITSLRFFLNLCFFGPPSPGGVFAALSSQRFLSL